jgi:hypothetical protein
MGDILTSSLLRWLSKFFSSACTIQVNTPTVDAHGQPIAAWADKTGHVAIPCKRAPVSESERRSLGQMVESATHVVSLYGAYPLITPVMRAVVDGTTHDITGVRADSEGVITYLGVKVVAI